MAHLLIVIVNYKTASLTINCLRSLVSEVQSLPKVSVVVVDNASDDDSVEQIKIAIETENWGNWVSLLPSKHNGGYAFGNNLAIRQALQSNKPPDYFLLLNSDTEVRPEALDVLLAFMEQHPTVGIAGSSLETSDGNLWGKAFHFPTVLSELEASLRLGVVSKLLSNWVVCYSMPSEPCQTDWVCGASLFIRRQVFESAGLLDEGYFLYYEETDFCLQANRTGWSCWYVPQSRIMHIGGQSSKKANSSSSKRIPQYWFESRQRYFLKNHGVFYTALADATWILGFTLWQIRRMIQRKPYTEPPFFLRDFIRNSVFLKGYLLKPSLTK